MAKGQWLDGQTRTEVPVVDPGGIGTYRMPGFIVAALVRVQPILNPRHRIGQRPMPVVKIVAPNYGRRMLFTATAARKGPLPGSNPVPKRSF